MKFEEIVRHAWQGQHEIKTAAMGDEQEVPEPIVSSVGQYSPSKSTLQEYVEILEHFLSLNNITDEVHKRSLLLTLCDPETYHVVQGLVPATPKDKLCKELRGSKIILRLD